MKKVQTTVNLILKTVAVGMAVSSITLGFLGVDASTQVGMLGIGLFALAVSAVQQKERPV